jgi:hypothetical protein
MPAGGGRRRWSRLLELLLHAAAPPPGTRAMRRGSRDAQGAVARSLVG